jgi:hypothetical protein
MRGTPRLESAESTLAGGRVRNFPSSLGGKHRDQGTGVRLRARALYVPLTEALLIANHALSSVC